MPTTTAISTTTPQIADQDTLPEAQFVVDEPNNKSDKNKRVPTATPVKVIDPAASAPPTSNGRPGQFLLLTNREPVPFIKNGSVVAQDTDSERRVPFTQSNPWITVLLISILVGGLSGGIYGVYTLLAEPVSVEQHRIDAKGNDTRAPTSFTADVYGIEFVYAPTPVPTPIKQVFEQAKARWQSILVEPGVSPRPPPGYLCGHEERYYDGVERIDDLEIWVDVAPMDGPGGILGYAGPCNLVVSGTWRAVTGEMVFDLYDLNGLLADGTLVDVISHEMGHVLGLGSFWGPGYRELVRGPSYEYTGVNGIAGFRAVTGLSSGSPPIERDGDSGTALSHWDDAYFGNELMTGYISSGSNPLSLMTVRALEDLGYIVNRNAAEPYTKPSGRRLRGGRGRDDDDQPDDDVGDEQRNNTGKPRRGHRIIHDLLHDRRRFEIVQVPAD